MARTGIFLLATLLATGCATNKGYSEDRHYKVMVEQGSILQGAKVYWVNPPQHEEPIIIEQHQEPAAPAAQ